ncbi:hypothetical protein KKF05_00085 [Patescibacteria group bacterium]|nr:hypothetical protein [Patescibacteria group bacterium]MBU1028755.1 hypothetical protein [Patescibacteria group bacterium]
MNGVLADSISIFHYIWAATSVVLLGLMMASAIILLIRPNFKFYWWLSWLGASAMIVWSSLTLFAQAICGGCPLTQIENDLRAADNPLFIPMESFLVDFCQRYVGCDPDPSTITHLTCLIFGLSIVSLSLLIFMYRLWPSKQRGRESSIESTIDKD